MYTTKQLCERFGLTYTNKNGSRNLILYAFTHNIPLKAVGNTKARKWIVEGEE